MAIIFYNLGVIMILVVRRCPKMDRKALSNIGINVISFSVKTTTWTMILIAYDHKTEIELGSKNYSDKLWDDEAHWFLFDYFAAYVIKMSIYVFIFEMRQILDYLTSDSEKYFFRS